jgi:histidinol-phosphatase (PHP family)
VAAAASAALRAVAAAGMRVEINTAGLRKAVGEAYPAPALLVEAHALGVPLVLGSDAHRPEHVGYAFDRAAELARAAGYEALSRPYADAVEPLA